MLMQFKETRQLSMLNFIFSFSVNKKHGLRRGMGKNYLKKQVGKTMFKKNEVTYRFFSF